jgi:hypothetical protein
VLELGKSGSAGYPKGELPVLRDGSPVALLRASNWKESATAVVGDREWVFVKHKGELVGRWAAEPQDAVRLRARQKSLWKGTWTVDLEGRPPVRERGPAARRERHDGRLVAPPDPHGR